MVSGSVLLLWTFLLLRGSEGGTGVGTRTEHVVAELGELETEAAELLLGLGTEGVAAGGPEVGDGHADGRVLGRRVLVDVAGVGDLALGGRVDAVDLARRQVLEAGQAELVGQRVHARVLEQLVARHVHLGDRRVLLERPLAGNLAREVVARVQELEEAADRVEVFVGEFDLARLFVGRRKRKENARVHMSAGLFLLFFQEQLRYKESVEDTKKKVRTLPSSANSAHASAK